MVNDSGLLDIVASDARQTPVEALPDDTLLFLLGSRYCETDRLSDVALATVRHDADRVARACRRSAISSIGHITFGYEHARSTRTAWEALQRAARRVPRLRAPRRSRSAAA